MTATDKAVKKALREAEIALHEAGSREGNSSETKIAIADMWIRLAAQQAMLA